MSHQRERCKRLHCLAIGYVSCFFVYFMVIPFKCTIFQSELAISSMTEDEKIDHAIEQSISAYHPSKFVFILLKYSFLVLEKLRQ